MLELTQHCPECNDEAFSLWYDENNDLYICNTCGVVIDGNYFDR